MVAFMVLGALTTGLIFAVVSGTVSSVSERTRTTQRILELEEALRVSILGQETFVLDFALSRSSRASEEFSEAVASELDAYIELSRIAPDDEALITVATNMRELATTWRVRWAEPFLRSPDVATQAAAEANIEESERLFAPVEEALTELDALTIQRRDATEADLSGTVQDLARFLIPMGVASTVLLGLLGAWLTRSISGPLLRLNRTARSILAGEQVTFAAEHNDEIGGLAVALEQLRVDASVRYRDARVEAETAATFNQLAELTSFAQDEDTLVRAATLVLERIAPSVRGHVMLLNNSTNRLIVGAAWGDPAPKVGSAAEIDRIDSCPGIRRATAYVAEDLSDALAVRCPVHSAESGTVVCLPMPALGSIVGVIHLERTQPNSFEPETVQRAARIAEQVALAIANARLMKTMEGLAMTDPLTGLRNARFFDSYLEQQLLVAEREKESVGLIMLDVDHFKQFNDTYGHPAGDEALRALARTMRSVIRASDVVARYGGEEFIIAMSDATLPDVRLVAEKIRAAVEQTVVEIGPGRYGRITVSLGIVATDTHRVDQKGLVSLADAALYKAKAGGRNRVEGAPTSTDELTAAARRRSARDGNEPVILPVNVARRRTPRQGPAAKPRIAEG
jgi:diguanylate cyclase (GGDEF)-like protein